VTQLRQKMLEELQRRNYSHRTAKTYVRIVRDFADYFHQPPDKLGPEQIRQYQAHLFQAKKLAPATVSQYVSALRFLFIKTLHRYFLAEYIPFPKAHKRLPTVLSPEEVTRLIDTARNLYHRTLLMTLYSTSSNHAALHSASFCSDSRSVCTHRNPPQSTTYFPELPAPDRLLGPTNTLADIFYYSAQPNPTTNKSRIAHAKPIAPPRPPRQRLRTNLPIASAPAGNTWVPAEAHRRRTCR
jgi:Phage integrase, N-terminal SAM-like domain